MSAWSQRLERLVRLGLHPPSPLSFLPWADPSPRAVGPRGSLPALWWLQGPDPTPHW